MGNRWRGYGSDQEGADTDLIPEGSVVPRPDRFSDGRPTGEAKILSQQDGRLGFDQDDPPQGLEDTARLLHDARNARDLP